MRETEELQKLFLLFISVLCLLILCMHQKLDEILAHVHAHVTLFLVPPHPSTYR